MAQLGLFSDTFDEWMACQRAWMYIEAIFAAPDMQRQLPEVYKMFNGVDNTWRRLMKKVEYDPGAMKQVTAPGLLEAMSVTVGYCRLLSVTVGYCLLQVTAPGLLEAMRQANATLQTVQRRVEEHLETKRQV